MAILGHARAQAMQRAQRLSSTVYPFSKDSAFAERGHAITH